MGLFEDISHEYSCCSIWGDSILLSLGYISQSGIVGVQAGLTFKLSPSTYEYPDYAVSLPTVNAGNFAHFNLSGKCAARVGDCLTCVLCKACGVVLDVDSTTWV